MLRSRWKLGAHSTGAWNTGWVWGGGQDHGSPAQSRGRGGAVRVRAPSLGNDCVWAPTPLPGPPPRPPPLTSVN